MCGWPRSITLTLWKHQEKEASPSGQQDLKDSVNLRTVSPRRGVTLGKLSSPGVALSQEK